MSEEQLNGTMLQGFSWNLPADGQHWRRLGQMADRLVSEGITSVWMPPAYKGQAGVRDVGYGVYDLWDLGEFDQRGGVATKYGTRREYVSAVVALKQSGIDVLGDIVLNHKMGADEAEELMARPVASDNRLYDMGPLEPITAWTRFTFPGRAGELDDFVWDWTCFKGVDYDASGERGGLWLFDGKTWDDDVSHEMGNYDYLMGVDVDLGNPDVYEQLVKWGAWYLEASGVDGFRLDAIKHMSRAFYTRWLADMRAAAGRELFCVGEYWSPGVQDLVSYLGSEPDMSLFDVPLHFAFYQASVDREHIDFARMLDGAFVTADPVHAVTFVDNHDTQPNQALESTVQPWFKPVAYAVILLREAGYPCVFFADLFGLPSDAIPAVAELPLLMEIRRRFAYGAQRDYFDDPSLVGWTREGDGSRVGSGVAAILWNQPSPQDEGDADASGDAEDGDVEDGKAAPPVEEPQEAVPDQEESLPTKAMCVGAHHAGETWQCVLGDVASVEIDGEGVGRFPVSTTSMVAVYVPEDAVARLDHIPIVMSR